MRDWKRSASCVEREKWYTRAERSQNLFLQRLLGTNAVFTWSMLVDLWEKMKWQVQAEQMHSKALAPGPLSPTQIVSKYKVFIPWTHLTEKERLREEGWNSVRPAMAVTVRANFVLVTCRPYDNLIQLGSHESGSRSIWWGVPSNATEYRHRRRNYSGIPSLEDSWSWNSWKYVQANSYSLHADHPRQCSYQSQFLLLRSTNISHEHQLNLLLHFH